MKREPVKSPSAIQLGSSKTRFQMSAIILSVECSQGFSVPVISQTIGTTSLEKCVAVPQGRSAIVALELFFKLCDGLATLSHGEGSECSFSIVAMDCEHSN
jgi:hypothetical protein